ncbi:MAG: DUF5455 family protein [Gammaproteobacteria bacterium]
MPVLAQLLVGLFGGLVDFFAKFVTKKVALMAAFVAAFVAFSAAFIATVAGIASAIVPSVPTWLSVPLTWAVPSNVTACLSAYVAARAARWVYVANVRVAAMKV